jgi:galactose mutarotase-like enzyme
VTRSQSSPGRSTIPPSGEQFEIAHGEQRATVVEVGGGLRSYSVGGRDLLDGYGLDEMCTSGRGQLLLPWPNRIEDGSYEFGGENLQLALDEPERNNAIHGLVRWSTWRLVDRAANRVSLSQMVHPQPGYPFTLALRVDYMLDDDGLSVRTTATNIGVGACPFGAGAHPYLTLGTESIDELTLHVPAETILLSNERGLPTAEQRVEGTEYDFRQARAIGGTQLDTAFTTLQRDGDGRVRTELRSSDDGGATLWIDESYRYLMVFTGDPLPDVNRRAIAVEPMTCPPNAFRTGTDLVVLEPSASWNGAWGIRRA